MNKSRGRPPGNPQTKEHIAEAARNLFLQHGYRGTTIRAIAAQAGVDSALISYHFGSKQGLFGESMQLSCSRSLAVAKAFEGDREGLPDRLLRAVVEAWEEGDPTGAMSTMPGEDVMRVFREYLERELLGRIAEFLGGTDATERATAAVSVLGGLIFTRYLNPLGPSAAMPIDDIQRIFTPLLRASLRGRRPTTLARSTGPVEARGVVV